jgi:hypothetical protein
MFAYCNNNPVARADTSGQALETVLDVISLSASIVDVAMNPSDPWAWAGLAGDIVDVAIPFVGGVGEVVRGVNTARKAAEAADGVKDAVRTASNLPVVIGESMQRVQKFADEIGAEVFTPSPGLSSEGIMAENMQWIDNVMAQGRKIYDIGPVKGKGTSPFYKMESDAIKGYANVIRVYDS